MLRFSGHVCIETHFDSPCITLERALSLITKLYFISSVYLWFFHSSLYGYFITLWLFSTVSTFSVYRQVLEVVNLISGMPLPDPYSHLVSKHLGVTNDQLFTQSKEMSSFVLSAVNPCCYYPCQNSGVCVRFGTDRYECDCTRTGFYGENCTSRKYNKLRLVLSYGCGI